MTWGVRLIIMSDKHEYRLSGWWGCGLGFRCGLGKRCNLIIKEFHSLHSFFQWCISQYTGVCFLCVSTFVCQLFTITLLTLLLMTMRMTQLPFVYICSGIHNPHVIKHCMEYFILVITETRLAVMLCFVWELLFVLSDSHITLLLRCTTCNSLILSRWGTGTGIWPLRGWDGSVSGNWTWATAVTEQKSSHRSDLSSIKILSQDVKTTVHKWFLSYINDLKQCCKEKWAKLCQRLINSYRKRQVIVAKPGLLYC